MVQQNNPHTAIPLVSVVTPVYNAEKFIARAIECVKMQGIKLEHIIVDDCSTDSTPARLEQLAKKYPHIIYIRLDENKGPSIARDIALNSARGRYIAFLDADDLWLPEKLERQIAFMQDRDCAITYTDYRFISETADLIGSVVKGPMHLSRKMHFMTRSGLACLTVMIDRHKVKDWKFSSPEAGAAVALAEDFWAWAKVLESANFAYRVPFDLARYTITPGSRSSDPIGKARVVWNVYREAEGLVFVNALFFFMIYLISSAWKRLTKGPRFDLKAIDGGVHPNWLAIVRSVVSQDVPRNG